MAHYMIKYNDAWYVNKDLYISAFTTGIRNFVSKLMRKEVESEVIFDEELCKIGLMEKLSVEGQYPGIIRQDLDIALTEVYLPELYLPEIDTTEASKLTGIKIIHLEQMAEKCYQTPKYSAAPRCPDWLQRSAVKLREIKLGNKYSITDQLPIIHVCGTAYVLLDSVPGDESVAAILVHVKA